jgi:hypothetical protein
MPTIKVAPTRKLCTPIYGAVHYEYFGDLVFIVVELLDSSHLVVVELLSKKLLSIFITNAGCSSGI